MNMPGQWVDLLRQRRPIRKLILDMDSSVSETYGDQEGRTYNGHFGCECYHPLFLFNQDGDVEYAKLRPVNVARADMMDGGNAEHDRRIRTSAMGVACQHPNGPIDDAGRRPEPRTGVIRAALVTDGLGFLGGGVILVAENSGGVAGWRSNGKCQLGVYP